MTQLLSSLRAQRSNLAGGDPALEQRRVVQARVLAADRVGDCLFEARNALPFGRRAHMPVAADLVDAPVDLQPVVVGIAEFDRELAPGATAPGEIDRNPVPPQMVAGADDLVEGGDLE